MAICGTAIRPRRSLFRLSAAMRLEYDNKHPAKIRGRKHAMKICCYAHASSAVFFRALVKHCNVSGDDIEWSVITPQAPFYDHFDDLIPAERRLYLYRDFDRRYREMQPPFEWIDNPRFDSIYLTLARDKNGYRKIDKDEQLRRAAVVTAIYREFLKRIRPDYLLLPDVEAVNGYILSNLCVELGIPMLNYIDMRILGRAFFGLDFHDNLPPYFGSHSEADRAIAKDVIADFRAGKPRAAFAKFPPSRPSKPSLLRRIFRNSWLRWRYERLHESEETLGMRIRINVFPAVAIIRRRRFDARHAQFFDIVTPDEPLPPRYILYMLQKSPESSINGFEPYFVDQMRVIDLLLYNMPADYKLVVKEHPASIGIRSRDFYRSLRRKPGAVMAHPDVPSPRLIDGASLVVSVTGTVGLECYLLGKPAMLIGSVFFKHLCHHLGSFDGLGDQLRAIIANPQVATEDEREIEIAKLLNIGAEFVISDPWFVPGVCAPDNIAAAREHMWESINRRGDSSVPRTLHRARHSG
jgi:hypothetical protein